MNQIIRFSDSRVLPYVLTAGFLAIAAVVGLVIATGNLILIALVIGGVLGLLLLNALPVAVWLLLIGVFLVNGPIGYFFPELARISWLFSLLGVFMMGAALLYAVVGRTAPKRPVPAFIIVAVVLLTFACATAVLSNGPLPEIMAGAKRHFQFWGVFFLMAVVPFKERTVKSWMVFLLVVALLQLPLAAYQRIALVPRVMGLDIPGFVAFDIVVGTFEGSMTGGGASAVLALFLVLAAIGLICAYQERLIGVGAFLASLVVVLVPLGMGETKVVLFLAPIALLAAYHDLLARRPLLFLGGAMATAMLSAALVYLYFVVQVVDDAMGFQDTLQATLAYNFGDQPYYGTGVNRLTAIPYWFESQSWADPIRFLIGHGVGASYGGDGRAPESGHMFSVHSGMYIDLLSMSLVLWDFGIVGGLLFVAMILLALRSAFRNIAEATTRFDRVFCRLMLASLAANCVMLVYSSSLVVAVSHGFIFAITLGLTAWRARHGPMQEDSERSPARAPKAAYPTTGLAGARREPVFNAELSGDGGGYR